MADNLGGFARRVAIGAAAVFGVAIFLYLIYYLHIILAVVFISIVIAAALRPVAIRIQKRSPLNYAASIGIIYLGIVLLIVTSVQLVLPVVSENITAATNSIPSIIGQAGATVESITNTISPTSSAQSNQTSSETVKNVGISAVESLATVPLGIITTVAWTISCFVLAFYWLLERDIVLSKVAELTPISHRRQVYQAWISVERKLGAYVLGQMVAGLVIGSLTFIGLFSLGVKYALLLAIFAAIVELIPMIGPFIAAAPAIVIAFFQSPVTALIVAALYILIQQIEGNIVYPKIQERISHISAFWLILSLLIGAELMGILGALVAVSIVVTIQAIYEELRPVSEVSDKLAPVRANPNAVEPPTRLTS